MLSFFFSFSFSIFICFISVGVAAAIAKFQHLTSPINNNDYPDDQPCDLRLLTPATCLRELPVPLSITSVGSKSSLAPTTSTPSIPPGIAADLALVKVEMPTDISSDFKMDTGGGDGGGGGGSNKNDGETSNNTSGSSTGTGGGGNFSSSNISTGGTTTGGAYMCKQCGNSYARPHSLNRHIRFECGVEPKFECPICHKKSKHKHNLVLHMRTHQHR